MSSTQNATYTKRTKTAKRITVFLNGNQYDSYKLVINSKKLRKWHHILNEITQKLNPYFGTIKKLYSSSSGMSLNSFTDLHDNDTYIASDSRKFQFIEGGYNNGKKNTCNYSENCLTANLDSANKSKKNPWVRQHNITIHVFNNGKYRESPKKIVLSKEDLFNWENTVSFIALILDMPYRSIKFLYNAGGRAICGPWELQHEHCYIAVGYHDRFIKRNYDADCKRCTANSSWPHNSKWTNIPRANQTKNAIILKSIPKIGGQCSYYDISTSDMSVHDELEIKKLSDFHCLHTDYELN